MKAIQHKIYRIPTQPPYKRYFSEVISVIQYNTHYIDSNTLLYQWLTCKEMGECAWCPHLEAHK